MDEIDISDAVGAGFGQITRKPLAVLAWGALPMAVFVAVFLMFGGGIISAIVSLAQNARAEPRPDQIFPLICAFFGANLVLIIGIVILGTMIRAAPVRIG